MKEFSDMIAVVAGSGSGMGRELVRRLLSGCGALLGPGGAWYCHVWLPV